MPTPDARLDDVPSLRSHSAIGPVNSLCDKEITDTPFWEPTLVKQSLYGRIYEQHDAAEYLLVDTQYRKVSTGRRAVSANMYPSIPENCE